jgi:hypothetical protein
LSWTEVIVAAQCTVRNLLFVIYRCYPPLDTAMVESYHLEPSDPDAWHAATIEANSSKSMVPLPSASDSRSIFESVPTG